MTSKTVGEAPVQVRGRHQPVQIYRIVGAGVRADRRTAASTEGLAAGAAVV